MKKMNLKFFGLKAKMVLPLFLLMGLFMFSASSLSAQYVSNEEAKQMIDEHMTNLPPSVHYFKAIGQMPTQQIADEELNSLRRMYGEVLIEKLKNVNDVALAIEKTYEFADGRVVEEGLNLVKQEYIDLLTE